MKPMRRLAKTAAVAALTGAAALAIGQTTPRLTQASASVSDSGTWTQAGPFGWKGMVSATETIVNDTASDLNLDTSQLDTYQTWFTAPLTIPAGQSGQVQVNVGAYSKSGGSFDAGSPGDDYADIYYTGSGGNVYDFHLHGSQHDGECGKYELNGVDWYVNWNGNTLAVPNAHMEPDTDDGDNCPGTLPNSSITISDGTNGGGSPFQSVAGTWTQASGGDGQSRTFAASDFSSISVNDQNSDVLWAGWATINNGMFSTASVPAADDIEDLVVTDDGDGEIGSAVTITGSIANPGHYRSTGFLLQGTITGWTPNGGVPEIAINPGTLSGVNNNDFLVTDNISGLQINA